MLMILRGFLVSKRYMRTLLLICIFSHVRRNKEMHHWDEHIEPKLPQTTNSNTQTLFDTRSQDGCAVYGFSQGTTSGVQLQPTELLESLAFKKTFASHCSNYGDMKVLWLQSFGYV